MKLKEQDFNTILEIIRYRFRFKGRLSEMFTEIVRCKDQYYFKRKIKLIRS